MKSLKIGVIVAAAGLLLAACGSDDNNSSGGDATTTAPAGATTTAGKCAPKPDGLKVGLLYDVTGRGDNSFNDAAAAGADLAVCDYGIQLTESTPTGDADRQQRIDLLSTQDQLVLAVGFLWGDAVSVAATANTAVSYGIVDSVVDKPNVASMTFAEEQGSYLVGVGAAKMSKKGSIGFIGGVENDLIKKFEAGFTAGAKSVNPDIKVAVKYITQPPDFTGFNDAAKGKEIGAAMYAAGADVVYAAAGGSGNGLFAAAKEAGAPGSVWAIGVDSDQYLQVADDLKPYILTSMLKRVDVAVHATIKSAVEGTFAGGITRFDLKNDGVGYSRSGDFLSADAKAAMDKARDDIIAGTVTVPTAP
jgi:basic membrane protein A and related proteins